MRALLIFTPVLLALAGCGGGSEQADTGRLPAGAPRPKQPLKDAVDAFERAMAEPTCRALEPLIHSQGRQSPLGGPLTASECGELTQRFRANLPRFRSVGVQQAGTGGVVDGSVAGKGQTAIFALDVDRRWKFVFAIPAARQTGTKPAQPTGFDQSARRFVDALRERDCGELFAVTSVSNPSLQAVRGDRRKLCRNTLRRAGPATLAGQLSKHAGARPQRMGATRDFAFYGLALRSGLYETVVMVTQPRSASPAQLRGKSAYGLLDVYPARPPRL